MSLPPLNIKDSISDNFVAFLDVMGFSNLVKNGNLKELEDYFNKIREILYALRNEKEKIKSFLISDSIILIAPSGLDGLRQLLIAIRRIQSVLLWKKILIRGAVSYGPVYYDKENNIIVGQGYIRAYLLEQEAKYPRVIIDPAIIKLVGQDRTSFLKSVNKTLNYNYELRLVYVRSQFGLIQDDGIFVDYANKSIKKDELIGNMARLHKTIVDNLYSEQSLYSKYIWLKDYFLEVLKLTRHSINSESVFDGAYAKELEKYIEKFERL